MKKIDEKSENLHRQFSEYGKNAKEWAKKCVLLLPEIDRCKVWKKNGFGSIYEYAAKVAGLSHRQVMEGLRLLSKVEDMPLLVKVIEKKGVNAVRPIATIVTNETEEFWAEKANNLSVNELVTYVRDFRKHANGSGGCNVTTSQPEKTTITITMELDPLTAEQFKKAKGQDEWDEAVRKLLALRSNELEKEKPEPVVTESRHVPAEIDRFVRARDNNTCVFPGCLKACAELHHVDGFALSKVHDPDRIFCLCEAHHDLAHRGLIENEDLAPQFWRVRSKPDPASPRFGVDQKAQNCRRFVV